MRPIREIVPILAIGGVVAVLASTGCAHSSRQLYPGAVSGSKRVVPDWVDSADGIPCGKGETCVIGVSRCAPDGPVALDASRMSAYARLASMAFPVDVAGVWKDYQTIELSGGIETSRTVISDDVRTELGGRVSGARVVDDYWALRRVHTMRGVSDCYDGWSLVSISTVDLQSLYPRELERSAWEVSRVVRELKPVEHALKGDDDVFGEYVPVAVSVFRSAEVTVGGLQQVDGLSELKGRLAAAESLFGRRMVIRLQTLVYNSSGGTADVALAIFAAGRPQPGLDLVIDGCGLDSAPTVTDSAGMAVVTVKHESPFSQCVMNLRFKGVSGFTGALPVPPAFAGCTVDVQVDASGYLKPKLQSFATDLARVEAGRLARPRVADGRPMVDFRLVVSIRARDPVPYNGRVEISTGEVEVSLVGMAEGRQVMSFSSGRRELRAVGLDQAQISGALQTQLGQAISDAVKSFQNSMGVQTRR